MEPEQISFIEAHGTGTVLGDMIEVKALGELHGVEREAPCGIGSIKGNLGHTEGAAGIAALIKVALSLHHGVVPPSRYAEQENPRLRLADHGLRLLGEPLELPAGTVHAGVSSFGLGGTNAHVVLAQRAAGSAADAAPDGSGGGLLTVSAPDRDGLQRAAAALADEIAIAAGRSPGPALLVEQQDQGLRPPPAGRPRRRPASRPSTPCGGRRTDESALREVAGGRPRRRDRLGLHRPGLAVPGHVARARRAVAPPYRNALGDVERRWRRTSAARSASCCSARTTRSTGPSSPSRRSSPSSTRSAGCSPRPASSRAGSSGTASASTPRPYTRRRLRPRRRVPADRRPREADAGAAARRRDGRRTDRPPAMSKRCIAGEPEIAWRASTGRATWCCPGPPPRSTGPCAARAERGGDAAADRRARVSTRR